MYKPKYAKIFLDEINQYVLCPGIGGEEYNRWAGKNKYTRAVHDILVNWGWPIIFPLVDHGIIKSNEDESLVWTLKNLDSLAQLFKEWPLFDDPDMPEEFKHIPGGFWGPVETAFNIKRGSLRYLVSTNGRYYEKPNPQYKYHKPNPEYKKVVEALRTELGDKYLETWNPRLKFCS